MHKLIKKVTSALTAFILVGSNFIPTIVYAANEIADLSTDENVLFDANINNNTSYIANIDEQLSLNINLSVVGDGYIKGGTIKIENNNYKLGDIEENSDIERVDDNTFELSQITDKNSINLSIPIEFERSEVTDIEYFEKDSSVKLNATYINEDGEEEDISKTINNHLKWDNEVEGIISQELKRYLKYENKTLVSFLVSSGIKDNSIPVTEKTIQILAPLVNNMEPSKVIVSGDNISYNYQNQVVFISKNYVSENKVQWNSNDEYIVTYIYDTQVEETDIETLAVMLAKTASKNNIEIRTENFSYHVKDNVGNLLEATIGGDNEINKGYMYTNLNRKENKLETLYNSVYQVNVGLVDFIDEIEIREFPSNYETIDKNISVDRDNLIEILGEDGTIRVLDQKNIELGVLNKDNLQIQANQFGLKFYTSKPIKEGNLNIFINKTINPNLVYTKENLSNTSYIQNIIDVFGKLQGQEVSYNNVVKNIELVEPQSNATITISKDNLSTVVTNEDVVITAVLEKNSIDDALYTNPEILITLPNQISNVVLKDAKLIYEDELVPVDFRMVGKQIYLKLEGTQTEYSLVPTADGTVIRIVLDMNLDNLAVNANEKITMQYTNMARNELKTIEVPVNIVAPTGFVTANEGSLSQTVSAITKDETVQIAANDVEKQLKLSGIVVSNLKENARGLAILGRIPSQDTIKTDTSNENLNSTFTTNLASAINIEGIEADIYYSDNGNATYDLNNSENGWSLEARDTSKSYLIVSKSEVAPAQKISFSYNVKVPRNINYENNAVSEYAVYYDNDSENGTSKNIIISKAINIATENIPIIRTEIVAEDYYTGDKIENGGNVNGEKLVKYLIRATNTGKKSAENVTVKVQRPTDSSFYINEYLEEHDLYDVHIDRSEALSKTIDSIAPGETKEVEFDINVYKSTENSNAIVRAEVTADNMLENSTASFENNIVDGTLELIISSEKTDKHVKIGEKISYRLSVENNNKDKINNINVKIDIPKYLEINNCDKGNYDEKNRTITYSLGELESFETFNIDATVISSEEANQEITLQAVAVFDGANKEIKSNKYTKVVQDTKGFSADLSSNITEKMLDTDTVEYYINVRNNSKESAEVNIYDSLPNELKIIKYIVKNESNVYTVEDENYTVNVNEIVEAGKNIKVTIIAKPYILDSVGQIKEIENKASIKINGQDLEINTIKQKIEGTSNYNTIINEQAKKEKGDIYSISGKIWHDQNSNSKKDENEVGIANVPVRLYNVLLGRDVTNEEGKIIEVLTNDNGEYDFEGLAKGQYMVVAKYDNDVYQITNYQTTNLSQNEDSDFIESNSKEAITNTITINEGNIYNVDLGLKDIEKFDIKISNAISKINVIDGKNSKNYDFNSNKALVSLSNPMNSTLIIEYLINVKNEGNIEGYVTSIENFIPKDIKFVSELNQNWYIDSNGNAVNKSIANKLLKPGETESIKLVLIKELKENDKQLIHSETKIKETYNKYGLEKVKRLSGINDEIADLVISKKENKILQVTIITIFLTTIFALIGLYSYKAINKKYKIQY